MLTIFACPKPFTNPHIALIQRNAITSWTLLRPKPEIILFGDEPGTSEICQELGLRYVPEIARSEFGTPLVSDIFEKAQQLATYDILCYVNADIILMSDFIWAIEQVKQWRKQFLIVGQRYDVDIREFWNFSRYDWENQLRMLAIQSGKQQAPGAVDYFVFPKGLFMDIPPFAIGRFTWDSWLVWRAISTKSAVVDVTPCVLVVHQNHDYSHAVGDEVWVRKGEEAQRNLELSGGWTHHYSTANANFILTHTGIRKALGGHYLVARLDVWKRRLIDWTRPLRHVIGLRKRTLDV